MRISDWSSDVCSSDLDHYLAAAHRVRTADARALARQAAADVAHVLFGRIHLQVDDRLQYLRAGLADRVQERPLARGDEGHLLAVDRMVLALVDDHPHFLHRVSGDRATVEHLAPAFLHSRQELSGDGALGHAKCRERVWSQSLISGAAHT